ncbi:WYL domain-containing protein [Actinomadura darangshiensis]|uniref:WYL domain-containing protein n=1 Tax=Actinomadura darangshiensis TaxID=705336 RepID=UPI001A9DF046|nr:WYL domain-containing protein [Actinomadura darangshiensis]
MGHLPGRQDRPARPRGRALHAGPLTDGDLTRLVVQNADRGDTPAQWPCRGSATIDLPAEVVARWAPGGSVVEPIDEDRCRFTIGGWSWMGVAGLFATFDADLHDIAPDDLRDAFRRLATRLRRA